MYLLSFFPILHESTDRFDVLHAADRSRTTERAHSGDSSSLLGDVTPLIRHTAQEDAIDDLRYDRSP